MPVSRNRKKHKVISRKRSEDVKKQQMAFRNRLMEDFKMKQQAEFAKQEKMTDVVTTGENLNEFALTEEQPVEVVAEPVENLSEFSLDKEEK